jgi:hypothetical protein
MNFGGSLSNQSPFRKRGQRTLAAAGSSPDAGLPK